jgi:hypothetical protein
MFGLSTSRTNTRASSIPSDVKIRRCITSDIAPCRSSHNASLTAHRSIIRSLARNAVRDILEIGARLREVRNALYDGEWEQWLDVEFSWSNRTARRYMAAAKAFADETDTVSELPIDIGAIHLLARATGCSRRVSHFPLKGDGTASDPSPAAPEHAQGAGERHCLRRYYPAELSLGRSRLIVEQAASLTWGGFAFGHHLYRFTRRIEGAWRRAPADGEDDKDDA